MLKAAPSGTSSAVRLRPLTGGPGGKLTSQLVRWLSEADVSAVPMPARWACTEIRPVSGALRQAVAETVTLTVSIACAPVASEKAQRPAEQSAEPRSMTPPGSV